MHLLAAMQNESGFYLILSAGVAMYIASKAAADAMLGGGSPTAGRLAIGQWMPIMVLGVAAMLLDRPLVAMGIVFSTAVACLSLASGAAIFLSPPEGPPASRRCWAMVLPAGFLAFLAGFRGEISWFNAGILLIEGLFVLLLWNDRAPQPPAPDPATPARPRRKWPLRGVQLLLAVALAFEGALLAVHGVGIAAATTELGSAGLMTATLISPMLVLPIIGTGSELAQQKQSSLAISSQVGVALLNVFLLVPLLVLMAHRQELVWQIRHLWAPPAPVVSLLHGRPSPMPVFHSELVFPLAVWRVDVVAVIALGLFLLPAAIGRWSLTKMQGLAMMLGYTVYLALSLLLVALREV